MFHCRHPSLRAFGSPLARGEPSYFTPLRPTEVSRFAPGSGLKLARLRFVWAVKAGNEKKADRNAVALCFQRKTPMLCRWPVLRTQPNSRCSASITGAEQVLRARFFRLEPGLPRGLTRTVFKSPTRSVWRFHVPPNLDSQYQRKKIFCQEKNAKCG